MPRDRIDVADPKEGPLIAATLRFGGFEVAERPLASLLEGTDAALLVVAGDASESAEVLSRLDTEGGPLVILVGRPPDAPGGMGALPADDVFERPISSDAILRRVQRRMHALFRASTPEPASAPPAAPTADRTMELEEEQSHAEAGWEASEVRSASSSLAPADPVGLGSGVQLSAELHQMFLDADRRLFPDLPPLELRFPGGDEAPEALVPDEVLEAVSVEVDPVAEEPFDAFTFVGLPHEHGGDSPGPLPPPSSAAGGSASTSSPAGGTGGSSAVAPAASSSASPASAAAGSSSSLSSSGSVHSSGTSWSGADASASAVESYPEASVVRESRPPGARRSDPPASAAGVDGSDEASAVGEQVGAPSVPDVREGELGRGECVRLLWRLYDRRFDGVARFVDDHGGRWELVLHAGDLSSLGGEIASRVVRDLAREGLLGEEAPSEEAAAELLERRVRAGLLPRFDVEVRLRHAREAALGELVAARRVRFELVRQSAAGGPVAGASPVGASLVAALVEAARRRLCLDDVAAMVGAGAFELRLGLEVRRRFREAGLEPEVADLFERHSGTLVQDLVGEVRPSVGLPGLIFAFASVEALRLLPAERGASDGARARRVAEEILRSAWAIAEEGDYFSIVGVDQDVGAPEVRAACDARRRELLTLPLEGEGQEALLEMRDRILDSLEEACAILSSERLREAYRRALGTP